MTENNNLGKDVERSGRGIISDNMRQFAWSESGNHKNAESKYTVLWLGFEMRNSE
jgi:hypothetical protein